MTARPSSPRARAAATALLVALTLAACGSRQPAPVDHYPWRPKMRVDTPPPPPVPDVPPSYMVLLNNDDGTTGQVVMQSTRGKQVLNKAREAADIAGPSTPFNVTEAQVKRDFGAALSARPDKPERYDLYFDSGKSVPNAASQPTLRQIVERSKKFVYLEVSVIGYTDPRGSAVANQRLSKARADGVVRRLREMGLRARSVGIEAGGESAENAPEAQKRRVEVVLR